MQTSDRFEFSGIFCSIKADSNVPTTQRFGILTLSIHLVALLLISHGR